MAQGSRADTSATPAEGAGANSAPVSPEAAAGSASPGGWTGPSVSLSFAMTTNVGRTRTGNEDTCGAEAAYGAFVVCDGMGGAAAGDVASELARDTFLESLKRFGGSSRTRLSEAVGAANQAVFRQAQRSRAQRGMGTTLVGVLCETAGQQPAAWVVHVGDSRCYRVRTGQLDLLTRDHSLVEEQIQARLMTRLEAESSPIRNIITRAIGSHASVEPEIAEHALEPGDVLLLASDGLTRELSDAAIAAVLQQQVGERAGQGLAPDAAALRKACAALVDAANRSGGHDNITVLLIAVG